MVLLIQNEKCTFNKISQEMRFIYPEYNTILFYYYFNKKKVFKINFYNYILLNIILTKKKIIKYFFKIKYY